MEGFKKKYRCLAICGSDEVSFIFLNPSIVISDTDNDRCSYTNEIISVFSQYFFDYFNELSNQKIFWHGKCFSIEEKKIKSYIKYRSNIIKNVLTTAFLIKHKNYIPNESMSSKLDKCKNYEDYDVLEPIQDGILFFDGDEIDLKEYYNDKVIKKNSQDITDDDNFSNLFDNNGTIFVD